MGLLSNNCMESKKRNVRLAVKQLITFFELKMYKDCKTIRLYLLAVKFLHAEAKVKITSAN